MAEKCIFCSKNKDKKAETIRFCIEKQAIIYKKEQGKYLTLLNKRTLI
jgi:hypothetical protein